MGLIPDEIIQQVIERNDIVETISSYFPLKRTGKNFKVNCPFHQEKTPSFVVNPDKQIFHCFGCGVGGNIVSFVMKQDHLEFPEAIRMLARRVGVDIPFEERDKTASNNIRQRIFHVNTLACEYFRKNLMTGKTKEARHAREYLKQRQVDLKTAKKFQIGFALNEWDGLIKYLKGHDISFGLMEKAGLIIARENHDGYYDRFRNRIIFPIFDTQSHCRAFGARTLDADQNSDHQSTAKYINSPETVVYTKGHHLFGFDLAKQSIAQKDLIIIVEGYMDCLMPIQMGVNHIVAALGTALTVEQVRLIRRYTKNIVLLFDTDQAGETATMRSLDILIEEKLNAKVASLGTVDQENTGKKQDPDSFIRAYGADVFYEQISRAVSIFQFKLNVLSKQYGKDTIEGKAQIAAHMLTMICMYDDELKKIEYTKQLASELRISEEVVLSELKKVGEKQAPRISKFIQEQQTSTELRIRAVERNVLQLIIEDHRFIEKTKNEVELTDFRDTRIRNVITKIFEWFDEGKKISNFNLINAFTEQEDQRLITELLAQEDSVLGDKDKLHADCLKRLKNERIKLQTEAVQEKIRYAEANGDQNKLDLLVRELNQLIKK